MELEAATTLLEEGLPLPVRAPLFLRLFGVKMLKCYQPSLGNKIRIIRRRLKMGITAAEMDGISLEAADRLVAKHGYSMCVIIAIGMYKGWLWPVLFSKITALWLLWNLTPQYLCSITYVIIAQSGTADFIDTTRCILGTNVLLPQLGQNPKKS